MTAFLHMVSVLDGAFSSSIPHFHVWLWLACFGLSIARGMRTVQNHIERRRTSLDGLSRDKASLFRSAGQVERKASLSPFYGKPVWYRALPWPAATLYVGAVLWFPWETIALTLVGAAFGAWRWARYRADRRAWKATHYTVGEDDHPLLALGWKAEETIRRPKLEYAEVATLAGLQRQLVAAKVPLPDSFKVAQEQAAAADLNARLQVSFLWTFDHGLRWAFGAEPVIPDYPQDVRVEFGRPIERGKLSVGIDLDTGRELLWDRKSAPHGQVVGETGGGKTIFLTARGVQWLLEDPDNEVIYCCTKPSGVWVAILSQHPRVTVAITPESIETTLHDLVMDGERRQAAVAVAGCDSDDEYEREYGVSIGAKVLIIFDELEDGVSPIVGESKEVKALRQAAHGYAELIARKFRSAGIHLLIGTQGAATDIVTPPLWRNTAFKVVCGPIPKRHAEQALGVHQVPDVPGAEVDERGNPVEETRVPGRGLVKLSSIAGVKRVQQSWLGPTQEWLNDGYVIESGRPRYPELG